MDNVPIDPELEKLIYEQDVPSPCFIVDEARLRKNLSTLASIATKADITIIHALKAFANYPLFPIFREYLPTCSASSLDEARLCFEEFGEKAHVYCPAYRTSEFEELCRYASHFVFNSLDQLERFGAATDKQQLGLRLNPECGEATSDKYNPCLPGSRLGVTSQSLGKHCPDNISGYHLHALCEGSAQALESVVEALEAKFTAQLKQAKWLNLGGGHLLTDTSYEQDRLLQLLHHLKHTWDLELILEPGAAAVWQAGYLVAEVQDIIHSGKVPTAMLDVSFTAHMPDCLEMPYHPQVIGEVARGEYTYRFGGVSCLAADSLGEFRFQTPLSIGKRVIFCDMLHYTTVKTTNFNGVHHPGLALWSQVADERYSATTAATSKVRFEMLKEHGYEMYRSRLG